MAERPSDDGFRRDIEGLRAVAVAFVVLHHAGVPWLSGGYIGVDVFFVVSGYLISGLLLREWRATGTVRLLPFYARRIRRLLPAAGLAFTATVGAAWFLLQPLVLPGLVKPGVLTALFVSNMWFARIGVDYLADAAPSPFRHFWSLAVEEQFYLVWPVLLLLALRYGRGRQGAVTGLLALIAVLSLTVSVVLTPLNQPWAFFGLPGRAWEFAVGGLVALAGPVWAALRPGRRARSAGQGCRRSS